MTLCNALATRWDAATGKPLATSDIIAGEGSLVFDANGQGFVLIHSIADFNEIRFESLGL